VLGLETATIREILDDPARTYCGTSASSTCTSPTGREGLAAGAHRGPRQGNQFTPEGKKAILKKLIEAEGFEKFLRRQVHRHQALRPRRRRIADPGAGADHQARRRAGREGHRPRHAASRPPERADPVMGKPHRAIFHEFKGGSAARTTSKARAT
jgi:2-oxoglutarate dehydrogenase E1 component